MASNCFRPPLLFLSSSGVSTTASISARKLSHGTRRSMAPSGSPSLTTLPSASKNPSGPIVASANQNLTHQIRTGREKQLFFEVPFSEGDDKSAHLLSASWAFGDVGQRCARLWPVPALFPI